MILLDGSQGPSAAGKVIESFGQFVVGGNYVVGAVIFLVLIAIQFIVVNHGEYTSAAAAAHDENRVQWDDGDPGDDIICTECFAAVELQHYLRGMSGDTGGQDFAIVDDDRLPTRGRLILLGNDKTNSAIQSLVRSQNTGELFAGLGVEGCLIRSFEGLFDVGDEPVRSSKREVIILGGAKRVGTLYSVYGFLDHLGVRWLSPGRIGEEIRTTDGFAWPHSLDLRQRPGFATRGFHAWENRGNPEFFDWMARNRLNYWCVQNDDHAGLKKRGIRMNCGGHRLQRMFINPAADYPYDHPRFDKDDGLPRDPYPSSKHYQGDADRDGRLTYREAHPDWYCLRDGKRRFDVLKYNFCSSNRHACDELMRNIVQALVEGKWRDADSINFWTADIGRWCQCERCVRLGSRTDRNILLVHRLDQELKRAMATGSLNRRVRIYFLAYGDVLQPPTRPLPEEFDYDNCIATFFPIARCYVHGFADPQCTEFNKRYQESFHGWFVAPDRHYQGQAFIGEYYNVSGYKCLPVMYARTMSVDIPYYHDQGARHMHYMHCTTKHWGTRSLTNWQFARTLWNPHLDADALLRNYFVARYQGAAEPMRALYNRLDTALCNVTMLKYRLNRRLNANEEDLFPQKHMKYEKTTFETDDGPDLVQMRDAIDDCLDILEDVQSLNLPARVRARLAEDAGPLEYASHTLHFYDVLVRADRLLQSGRRTEAVELLPEIQRSARALRDDTTSTKWSSTHANARNALAASYVTQAYERLIKELGQTSSPADRDAE
jgi:hypothetical protein